MALTGKELGRRLKSARESMQITQEAAARKLGVSRVALALIEGGKRPVNTTQLEKLAELYGRRLEDFLVAGDKPEKVALRFRVAEELIGRVGRSTFEPVIRRLREYTQLERLLGLDAKYRHPVKYEFPEPASVWDAIKAGQEIAESERQRLLLGGRPIKDIAGLLEIQGIRLLDMDMDPDISGLFMCDEETGLTILANPRHHAFRHAFTLAHEYCHVLVDRDRALLVSSGKSGKDLVEVRANAFAAAFLLPKAGVEEFFERIGKTGGTRTVLAIDGAKEPHEAEQRRTAKSIAIRLYDVVHLQHHYGVSWNATVYRLQNLGIITKDECQDLLSKSEEAKALRKLIKVDAPDTAREKTFETHDFNMRFFCLAVDAFCQELISHSRLKELLAMIGVGDAELKEMLKAIECSVKGSGN
jgi:Zn-dependent peptidase ImmA (M78 family)/DNA-binding XRE family transcriptional regulator